MKVYVESKYMPEKCSKCKFIGHYEKGIYSRSPHCCCELYLDLHQDEIRVDKNSRDERCPLQSLSDYTKQVRKEVVQELKNKMLYCSARFIGDCYYYNGKELDEIVDKIQGETK